MRFRGIIVRLNIVMFFLFLAVICYNCNKVEGSAVVFMDASQEASLSVSNPFYKNTSDSSLEKVVEDATSIALLSNMKTDIADLNNWIWPTDKPYTLTSYYGYRSGEFHTGIDIYSYSGYGSNVYSANNGTVVATDLSCIAGYTWCNYGRGNYIVINHNNSNYYTIYMHLSDIVVGVGDIVSGGDVIGKVGNTGNVIPVPTYSNPYGGTHLHFGVYIGNPLNGGSSFNPLTLW